MSNTIHQINQPAAVLTALPVDEPWSLTPESLLSYCAAQLRNMDGDIAARMRGQQSSRAAQNKLNEIREFLKNYDTGAGIGADDELAPPKVLQGLKDAYDLLPEGSPQREEIESLFNRFRNTCCMNGASESVSLKHYTAAQIAADGKRQGANNNADQKEIQSFLSSLTDISGSITKNTELDMINLQSLISQRGMAIQLTTNMMSKLNESLFSVVANLK